MMSNNKILTVSYGTFSCTLEGFDDSFGTMKAIAEYFRDLAADDRYFGAEPPQPDAEMLTRIAEREISRRVEAREHEGRIVLSASDREASDMLPAAVAAVGIAEEAAAAPEPQIEAAPQAEITPAPQIDDAPRAETTPEPENTDEDTGDAEAATAVAGDAVAPEEEDEVASEEEDEDATEVIAEENAEDALPAAADFDDMPEVALSEGEDDVAPQEAPETPAAEASVPDVEEDVVEDVPQSEVEAFFANSDVTAEAIGEDDEDAGVIEAEDVTKNMPAPADSIAAKLQRIRAVVSQGQQEAADDEMFEDEHAEDLTPQDAGDDMIAAVADEDDSIEAVADQDEDNSAASEDVIRQAAQDVEEALSIDDDAQAESADTAEDATQDDGGDDDLDAMLARLDTADTAEDAPAAEPAQAADEDEMGLDTLAAIMAADDGEPDAQDSGENLFDEADAEVAEEVETPRRARIIKVKRADIDAALASGQLEEVEEDGDDAETTTGLSDEEEAELMAELAQVEAELSTARSDTSEADDADEEIETHAEVEAEVDDEAGTDDAADETEVADAPEAETVDAAARAETAEPAAAEPASGDVQDDDVSRLMAEAENQMEEPEGSGRRSAFAHLKAAVMAKRADKDIGNDSIKDEGAFRSDLASVVKPRRPEVGEHRGERPEGPRPAPLKLVAEQRVDIDTAPRGPVRPRRIAASEEHTADDTGSFADYAAEMGAHNLPALLEAAASYLSFVEGRDQFSRPQLMTKVRQVEQQEFSREDGLRSFGQLLRAGKIEKISGGRFAVTGDIGYRPDQRAAS